MTRAKRIREVYAELRRALGDELASGEVLRLAAEIVSLAERRLLVDATDAPERPEFWSVDEMIGRRGWALVEEARRSGYFEDDEPAWAGWNRTVASLELAA